MLSCPVILRVLLANQNHLDVKFNWSVTLGELATIDNNITRLEILYVLNMRYRL